MSEVGKETLFQVAPVSSEAEGIARLQKTWVTPKVITATMEDTEAAANPSNDGGGTSQGS